MSAASYLSMRGVFLAGAGLLLSACRQEPPAALGTLEWDRITVPAPAAETIVGIRVREGQQVAAGAALLQLEPIRTAAQLQALEAQASQAGQALQELRSAEIVVVDKTGTVTKGRPELTDLVVAEGFADNDVLALVAAVEGRSEHPIAEAIVRAAEDRGW